MNKAERAAHKARMAGLKAAAVAIVATGKCPQCGAPLIRNTSLTGWFQCAAYGAKGFRGGLGQNRAEFDALPACSFQTFTD